MQAPAHSAAIIERGMLPAQSMCLAAGSLGIFKLPTLLRSCVLAGASSGALCSAAAALSARRNQASSQPAGSASARGILALPAPARLCKVNACADLHPSCSTCMCQCSASRRIASLCAGHKWAQPPAVQRLPLVSAEPTAQAQNLRRCRRPGPLGRTAAARRAARRCRPRTFALSRLLRACCMHNISRKCVRGFDKLKPTGFPYHTFPQCM